MKGPKVSDLSFCAGRVESGVALVASILQSEMCCVDVPALVIGMSNTDVGL